MVREAARLLSFPVETTVLDYPSLKQWPPGTEGAFRALVVGMPSETILPYREALGKAGFTLDALDVNLLSLVRLHRHCMGFSSEAAVICHIGDNESIIAVATDDEILGLRTVAWGYRPLVDKLMANLDGVKDVQTAAFLLGAYGMTPHDKGGNAPESGVPEARPAGPGRTVVQLVTPLVEKLLYEFHKLFSYVRSDTPGVALGGIYLYGMGHAISGLGSHIGQRLDMPVRHVDPMKSSLRDPGGRLTETSAAALMIPAMGLAMRRVPWL
jgi:type IV pilus assembly protein PilM